MSSLVQKRSEIISMRYRTITAVINREFWNTSSDSQNSLYVGAYGRGTAIDSLDCLKKVVNYIAL